MIATAAQADIAGDEASVPTDLQIADHGHRSDHAAFSLFSRLNGGLPATHAGFRTWLDGGAGQELYDELSASFGRKAIPFAAIPDDPTFPPRVSIGDSNPGLRVLALDMPLTTWNSIGRDQRAALTAAARETWWATTPPLVFAYTERIDAAPWQSAVLAIAEQDELAHRIAHSYLRAFAARIVPPSVG